MTLLFAYLLFFWDSVSLCFRPDCPDTHYVDQARLELTCLCLQSAGIKGIHHHCLKTHDFIGENQGALYNVIKLYVKLNNNNNNNSQLSLKYSWQWSPLITYEPQGARYKHSVSASRSCNMTSKKAICSQVIPVQSEQFTQIFLAFLSGRMVILITEDWKLLSVRIVWVYGMAQRVRHLLLRLTVKINSGNSWGWWGKQTPANCPLIYPPPYLLFSTCHYSVNSYNSSRVETNCSFLLRTKLEVFCHSHLSNYKTNQCPYWDLYLLAGIRQMLVSTTSYHVCADKEPTMGPKM